MTAEFGGDSLAGASFRDPESRVRKGENGLIREFSGEGIRAWNTVCSSGLAEELLQKKMLVPFVSCAGSAAKIPLEELPFFTYPYEWCFDQLRAAALLTLEVMFAALERNMILKDASAFNVSFAGCRPVFIDHGSFTFYREGGTWSGYRQFCRHFLAPLLVMRYCDVREGLQLRNFLDGLPFDYAIAHLPWLAKMRPGVWMHLILHEKMERKYSLAAGDDPVQIPALPKSRLIALLRSLESLILSLKLPAGNSEWDNYYEDHSYERSSFAAKKELTARICRDLQGKKVIDFGANSGVFSRIAAESAEAVLSADIDHGALTALWKNGNEKITPVWQDLNNPSPWCGIANEERSSFLHRAKGDLAMGLALVHHLRIGSLWPMERIAELFAQTAPAALVEFVPAEDVQVRRLLRARENIFEDYTPERFLAVFRRHYAGLQVFPLPESGRFLLLAKERIG